MPLHLVALLILLAALWGGSFVFMRVAVPALGPVPLAYARVTLAALALLALALAQRRIPAFATRWREFAVVGVVNTALPFALFSYAAQHVPVSTSAILNATSPFFGAILGAVWLHERLTIAKGAGLVLGLAGVVILVGWHPQSASREVLLAVAACLVAALLYAIASVYTKRKLASEPSFAVACASLVAASFALMLALPFTSVPGPVTPLVAANVLGLAIGSTAVAYLIYFKLIAEAGPQRALTVTFLLPLFAALWGYVFLGEALTAYTVAGGVLIVAGTALALRG